VAAIREENAVSRTASAVAAAAEEDAGMAQLMAILDQCMELLEKREEIKRRQGEVRPVVTAAAVQAVKAKGRAKDPLLIAVLADFAEKRDVEQLLDHLFVIALEAASGEGEDEKDEEKVEEVEDVAEEADETESKNESEGNVSTTTDGSLQVSDLQQKSMIVEAMFQEKIIDELEKQVQMKLIEFGIFTVPS
jgi:non-canonical (house-cleaning) NTP pyrophosphatase